MSISHNVGGLNDYLARIRTSRGYFNFKRCLENCLSKIPTVGIPLAKTLKLFKDSIRRFFIKDTFFEDLGLVYLGPADGHDINKLTQVLTEAKSKHRCCVVHMITKKGRGYTFAEREPDKYHAVGSFDASVGAAASTGGTFSAHMGDTLCALAAEDERICAITAAMRDGTGLTRFCAEYPDRFFDVGIAEEHAITFAGGLAAAGMLPAVALYSTFSQRVYDQVLHDVSIQKLPLLLLLDRCGIVAGDGITHQGIFDYPMFSSIPDVSIYSPERFSELSAVMKYALGKRQLAIVRYPKGGEDCTYDMRFHMSRDGYISYSDGIFDCEAIIITYGRTASEACRAVKILDGEKRVGIIKLIRIYPIDVVSIIPLISNAKLLYVFEEGIRSGGVGEKLAALLANGRHRVFIRAINGYLPHGSTDRLRSECGLTAECAVQDIVSLMDK